jgi:hypothetical protein
MIFGSSARPNARTSDPCIERTKHGTNITRTPGEQ